MSSAATFEVPFLLGMMRLHEEPALHPPARLADWIEARLDEGHDWFDHADIYGDRQGEALFGAALGARPGLANRVKVVTKASIVTPEREVLRAQVDTVELPGAEGYFGVLPGHTPMLATLCSTRRSIFGRGRASTRISGKASGGGCQASASSCKRTPSSFSSSTCARVISPLSTPTRNQSPSCG